MDPLAHRLFHAVAPSAVGTNTTPSTAPLHTCVVAKQAKQTNIKQDTRPNGSDVSLCTCSYVSLCTCMPYSDSHPAKTRVTSPASSPLLGEGGSGKAIAHQRRTVAPRHHNTPVMCPCLLILSSISKAKKCNYTLFSSIASVELARVALRMSHTYNQLSDMLNSMRPMHAVLPHICCYRPHGAD